MNISQKYLVNCNYYNQVTCYIVISNMVRNWKNISELQWNAVSQALKGNKNLFGSSTFRHSEGYVKFHPEHIYTE